MRWPRVARLLIWVVLGALALWAVGWAMGFTIATPLLVGLASAAVLFTVLSEATAVDTHRPEWPDPTPARPQRWFGMDADVRRLSRLVDESSRDAASANCLRQLLRDELGRRLVERHGADASRPLAGAPAALGASLWKQLDPDDTHNRRMDRGTLNRLLTRIEEL